jgi:phenylpyruvate tautomerase PptA (4-oxalocrotonate tautomerase family)
MPTAKIYGLRSEIEPVQDALSDAIHDCVSDALKFPREKRLQRFILLDGKDFRYGEGRTGKYTVIEIAFFEGRSVETVKSLIRMLYERVPAATGIPREMIDITIHEIPRTHWGLMGRLGDEQELGYDVAV